MTSIFDKSKEIKKKKKCCKNPIDYILKTIKTVSGYTSLADVFSDILLAVKIYDEVSKTNSMPYKIAFAMSLLSITTPYMIS